MYRWTFADWQERQERHQVVMSRDKCLRRRPNITRGNEAVGRMDTWVGKIMNVMKNSFTERKRNQRTALPSGEVSVKRMSKNVMLAVV